MTRASFAKVLPILDWLPGYDRRAAASDGMAGLIVAIMLVPQGMAYALLAGLPPEVGLYASIVPLVFYGLLGSSRALAVGPVAIVSLMVATTLGEINEAGSAGYLAGATLLAFLSGAILGSGRGAAGISGEFSQPPGDLGLFKRGCSGDWVLAAQTPVGSRYSAVASDHRDASCGP